MPMTMPRVEYQTARPFVLQRMLPRDGRVLVQVGDRVQPDDVVATGAEAGAPVVVPVATGLGVPLPAAARYLARAPGDMIGAGEVVAVKAGLIGRRELTAPAPGRIVSIEMGNLVLQADPETISVRALIGGTVAGVVPNRGVTVAARGLLLHGIGCAAGEAWGRLAVWAPSVELDPSQPTLTLVGHLDRETAEGMAGVALGVVAGTVAPAALAWLRSSRRPSLGPVLALEGIAEEDLPPRTWRARLALAGQFAALVVSDLGVQFGGQSALAVAQAPARGEALPAPEPINPGARVRALVGPCAGQYGTIVALPQQPVRLPSGHSARVAVVDYPTGRLEEPLVNLEQVVDG